MRLLNTTESTGVGIAIGAESLAVHGTDVLLSRGWNCPTTREDLVVTCIGTDMILSGGRNRSLAAVTEDDRNLVVFVDLKAVVAILRPAREKVVNASPGDVVDAHLNFWLAAVSTRNVR